MTPRLQPLLKLPPVQPNQHHPNQLRIKRSNKVDNDIATAVKQPASSIDNRIAATEFNVGAVLFCAMDLHMLLSSGSNKLCYICIYADKDASL